MKSIIVFILLVISPSLLAFEKQKIIFSADNNQGKTVDFEFYGVLFSEPANVLKLKKNRVNLEEKGVFDIATFLKKIYDVNLSGKEEEILALWLPEVRKGLAEKADDNYYSVNKSRFNMIKKMELKMVMDYGEVFICYVLHDFGDSGIWMIPYQLKKTKNTFFLTDELNGDYFFSNIGSLLLKDIVLNQLKYANESQRKAQQ